MTQQATTQQQPVATPNITQVLPQTIPAGSQTMTLKVTGTNFPTQAAILWNGAALTTTVVDANTLSGTIGSTSLSTPGTAQLKVQNTQTMQESPAVQVTIAATGTGSSSPLAISLTPLPQGTVGVPYTGALTITGGTSPYTWSVTTGQLPPGLSVAANGTISGTPTSSGNYSFGVTANDSSSSAQSATATVTLSVAAASGTPASLTINSSALSSGTIGSVYSSLLQASGGTAPYTWSITSGSLPAGLSLASTTGIISGTPTANGTASFTATVTDAGSPAQTKSVTLSLVIAPVTLTIASSTLPSGTQSTSYSRSLQASGGTAPYTWSISSGTLPTGLSLAPSSGVISGTPSVTGSFSFGVTVTDTGSPAQTTSATVTLSLVAAGTPLAISSTTLPGGTPNKSYSGTLNATGGTAPYNWSITTGTLPSGLSLAPATGIISGTPTASSTTSLTFTVTDSSSPAQAKSVTLSLVVAPVPIAIGTSTLPSGTKGTSYSNLLQVSGGTSPYSWSITNGSLPAGLTLAATTGLISGTPTAAGNTSFTATVTDGGSPAQTKSVTLSIVVAAPAPPALAITTSSLPGGTISTSYSNSLQASGGTTPYTWSITAGSLPAGLTLATTTGLISGTPTASGTSSFTATVTDAGSPAQTKSASLSIVVATASSSALTISATLSSGTAGTAYSSPMTATGGTPAYTWSITAGSLPSGLTLAATSGVISGTPSASGTYNFTATVSDNSNPVQTKSAATSIAVAAASAPSGPGTTWYVRPDGGSRYSANATTGQCDGKADAAYSGSGTNQHCAFNDYRYLYDDKSWQNSAWVIAGGDTVILRGGPYRVGYSAGDGSNVWCYGQSGGPYGCINPTIPAGTATQHTQILGENYASCGSQASETQLFGGFGVQMALNLKGAQFVDVKCIELTRHSQCIQHGSPAYPNTCNTSYPGIDDYVADGIFTDVNTHDLLLQDMWIHGFTDRGVIGPIGGLVTATRVDIAYNGMAGWDFDDGSGSNAGNGTASVNGVWNLNQTTIEWNGCNQEYPIVDQYPAISCYSQSTGGYGDGVGTPPGTCLASTINGSSFHNNTQDGLDLGHADTGTNCPLTIVNSTAYANNGGTFKLGPNENPSVFENNLVLANCLRMSQPISGTPSTYNTNLSDFCRANDAMSFNFRQGGTTILANNTVVSYAPTTFDIQCWDAPGEGSPGDTGAGCGSSALTFQNNLVLGYDNPGTYDQGGQVGGPGLFFIRDPLGTIVRNNNLYFGIGHGFTCPTGFAGEICQDPLFVSEPVWTGEPSLDNFNFNLTAGTPAMGAGTYLPSLTLDYSGVHRPNPPSIGALEPQ
jgi:Putative Ig domain